MWKEFREFIARGNVVDLAVGLVMGAAFGAIVNSLVNDIFMPPIGLILGGVNFSNLFIALDGKQYVSLAAAQAADAPVIAWGRFLQTVINFLVIAVAMFFLVRAANKIYKRPAPPPAEPPAEVKLLTEIRDLLKKE
ncbi:MAG: large-conductance mechanosensitive channel [Candidatus Roseilinea sp.]|nr:MAG: large-conductance mechanosensitive channel [Candidatus Roseilinea sp.]